MGRDAGGPPVSSSRGAERAALLSQTARAGRGPSWMLGRAGALVERARRSVWVHGETPAQFDGALETLREIMRGRPHVRLVLTSADPSTVAYLRRSFPDDLGAASPWNGTGAVRRFFARVSPRMVLLLDGGRTMGDRAIAEIVARGLPLVLLSPDDGTAFPAGVTDALRAAGERGRRLPLADGSAASARGAAAAMQDLLPESPDLPPVRQAWRIPSLRDRVGRSRAWASAASLLSRRRIDDRDALRDRLGSPRSILVLGNGPSSEDPRLATLGHDCLVRVNWRWQERGFLANPDLVFVGDPVTMTRVDGAVFGFWNVALEKGMLLRRLATRGPRPVEFATMERLSPVIRDVDWPSRPTNGALAVLAAASLAPRRLVLAGIDLFRHPAGRYPGEVLARNDYSHVHSMETDLAIMEIALRDFRGELVVPGEILRRELAARGLAVAGNP